MEPIVCVSARPKKSLAKLAKADNFLLAKWKTIWPSFSMQKSPKKDKREQEGLVADKVFATFLNSLIMHSKMQFIILK